MAQLSRIFLITILFCTVACGRGGSLVLEPAELERLKNKNSQELLWNSARPEGVVWTAFLLSAIATDPEAAANLLLGSAADMASFCPNYATATIPQRVNFWAFLISAIAKFESGFDPSAQNAGAVGLLQLSYADTKSFKGCKDLNANEPAKSLLNPLVNLGCGVSILAKQVQTRKVIAADYYWDISSRMEEISQLTRSLSFCR